MTKNDLISGCVMLVFGLLMLFYVIPTQTVTAGTYTISPALVPQICAGGISVLAIVLVLRSALALRARSTQEAEPARPMPWAPALMMLAIVAVAVLLFRYVHAAVATGFLVVALMFYLGERRPLALVCLPAALIVLGYVLFNKVLGIVVA